MTRVETPKRLLWVDDDGPDRVRHEERKLGDLGWRVQWALSAEAAARRLRKEVFSVVLLDQMLPWNDPNDQGRKGKEEVWAGCLLLHWLRGMGRPAKAPPMHEFDHGLFPHPARPENSKAKVILISAFYDEEIQDAFHDLEQDLVEVSKPIDLRALKEHLESRSARH